jgi:hypothetical protein
MIAHRSQICAHITCLTLGLVDMEVLARVYVACWPYYIRGMIVMEHYVQRPDVQATLPRTVLERMGWIVPDTPPCEPPYLPIPLHVQPLPPPIKQVVKAPRPRAEGAMSHHSNMRPTSYPPPYVDLNQINQQQQQQPQQQQWQAQAQAQAEYELQKFAHLNQQLANSSHSYHHLSCWPLHPYLTLPAMVSPPHAN